MALRRIAFSLVRYNPVVFTPKYNAMAMMVAAKRLSTVELTKNLTLFSTNDKKPKVVNLKLETTDSKPLVVLLSWMLAKKKHVLKIAEFYLDKGYDVINVSITPWQLLWPVKGTQVVARDVVTFLDKNNFYTPLLIHGFSVGGYVWGEVLVHMDADKEKYKHVLDKIKGQIWDSAADITEIPVGFPFALFPNNNVMQSAMRQYLIYHLKTFDKVATCHYIRSSQVFYGNLVKAPGLFLISKSDPIGSEKSNLRVKESWDSLGIQTYWKCWEKSPHVEHFRHHPEEYKAELEAFLSKIGLSEDTQEFKQQIRAKLPATLLLIGYVEKNPLYVEPLIIICMYRVAMLPGYKRTYRIKQLPQSFI